VERELRAVLAGTEDVEGEQLHRLAVLHGLPDELQRIHPTGYDTEPLHARIEGGYTGSRLRTEINSLRLSLAAADEHAANPRTREQLTDELAMLLIRPNDQLDPDSLRRAAVIARMPESVRPELPPRTQYNYDLPRVHLENAALNSYGTNAIDAARQVVIGNSTVGIGELVATVRNDAGSVELDRLAPTLRMVVMGAGTEQLERLGISDRMLLAAALNSARDGRVKTAVDTATREAHAIAMKMEPRDETERVVIDRLREQLDHSLGRIDGRLRGGYGNYVDYQNHGGAIANADLLLGLDEAARREAGIVGNAQAADLAADALPW
jgi:hypothetical protein